ncbi:unnamed protein product [Candidula unifasciata]|uniref:Alanine--glyoxylate aminotransferase n=1 Tax=Candidula unifasciata TaxID=100452 RepID=A0A8S3ZJ55_9EUPU|nr:unnamed protein product [Candidula unifasciata]
MISSTLGSKMKPRSASFLNILEKSIKFSTSARAWAPTVSQPPESLLKPLTVPHKLLMGAGPSNCSPRVLAAGKVPMLGHRQPETIEIMDEVQKGLRYLFQTHNEWTFAISATGNGAMEATVVNLLEPGETALVCANGMWGHRFAGMVEQNDCVAKIIVRPFGEVFNIEEIEKGLREHKPSIVFVVYGESSAGTVQPLEGIGELCHRYNALLVVDAVAILGGAPLFTDDWDIDVIYGATQKCMSAPPSLSPITFSQRARDKIASRKKPIRSYYFNAPAIADHWGCDGRSRGFHHTEMVTNVYMLRESLAIFAEEGLEKVWKSHRDCAQLLHQGLEHLGLEFLKVRNPCVTTVIVPDGVSRKDVSDYAMRHYRIDIPGGVPDMVDKVWRIGIMGYNSKAENIKLTLKAFSEALSSVQKKSTV